MLDENTCPINLLLYLKFSPPIDFLSFRFRALWQNKYKRARRKSELCRLSKTRTSVESPEPFASHVYRFILDLTDDFWRNILWSFWFLNSALVRMSSLVASSGTSLVQEQRCTLPMWRLYLPKCNPRAFYNPCNPPNPYNLLNLCNPSSVWCKPPNHCNHKNLCVKDYVERILQPVFKQFMMQY